MIVEQASFDRRTVDGAVVAVARERAADDIHRAVLEHEEHRGDDDARADALQVTPQRHDGEDENDEKVVFADQAEIGVDGPLRKEGEAVVEENATEDKLGNVTERLGAEAEQEQAGAGGDEADDPALDPHAHGERRQAQRLKADHAAGEAAHHVGEAGRAQFAIEVDFFIRGQLERGGVEQDRDDAGE